MEMVEVEVLKQWEGGAHSRNIFTPGERFTTTLNLARWLQKEKRVKIIEKKEKEELCHGQNMSLF